MNKSSEKSPEKMDRDINNLAPFFYARLKEALEDCAAQKINLWITEGYRSPKRQNWLYASGRTRDGAILTKARAWQSMHQYGLAVDLCGGTNKKPNWAMPWATIKKIMERHGLESLAPFEQSHFEIRCGHKTDQLYKLAHDEGLEAVWELVEQSLKAKP